MPIEGALAGLRVLEVCDTAAGAWCGKLLADLGAEVVKIGAVDASPRTFYLNTGKSVLAMDMAGDEGRRNVAALLPAVDVLIDDLDAARRASILGTPHRRWSGVPSPPLARPGPMPRSRGNT